MATATECAWLAGLFDGEGHISFDPHKRPNDRKAYVLVVTIGMTDRAAIDRVMLLVGVGSVRTAKRREGWRPCHVWKACSAKAEQFLSLVLPYLVTKRRQAELALEGIQVRRQSPRLPAPGLYGSLTPETCRVLDAHGAQIRALNHGV